MTPIISIVGRSNSGKTTLLEKLIAELSGRGYRIATVKHTPLGMQMDDGKNSSRHLAAGSAAVVMAGNAQMALLKPLAHPATLAEAARLLGDAYDLILTEGFKQDDAPKIEVHRREVGAPLTELKKLFAVVTDEPLATKIRQFAHDDIKDIADLIETGFIQPQQATTRLYVNDEEIELSAFPRDFVTHTVLGMSKSLKGVGKIKTLRLEIKLRDGEAT
ncbi:MAG: molybdopterin-guanine dinucleotide biosynthesis protein B [Dehalococcoidales bacterium]|nr:molybdopterin-guanine dinucleotide biosynthesis protein B [Dehalococcoidales bacterium]